MSIDRIVELAFVYFPVFMLIGFVCGIAYIIMIIAERRHNRVHRKRYNNIK